MPKPTKGPRLGGGPAHERLMLANLATALYTHKRIQTTETKAKRLRPLAERLITFAKRGDLHARRRVMQVIRDKSAVHELFTQIAPLVADRPGGYTRITKTGYRKGDNAPMAVIELVLEPVTPRSRGGADARSSRRGMAAPERAEAEAQADAAPGEQPSEDAVAGEQPSATPETGSDATTQQEAGDDPAGEGVSPAEATASEETDGQDRTGA